MPFPVGIAGFPDFSRPVPVYPAFLKYVVPVHLRFADDASQNLLFTVYSDGVCQVNGKFVFLHSPDGNAEAIYQLLRDAVV